MNSVRQTEAWTAYDGTMHKTERAALLSSVATILSGADKLAAEIDRNLPALMPLFQRLMDPRNAAPKPIDLNRTIGDLLDEGHSLEEIGAAPMRDEGDLLADAADDITAALAPIEEVDCADLRVGQLVETRDGWGLLIEQITCDNEPQPVVVGLGAPDGPIAPATRITVTLSDIVRVLKQPEDMMDLVTAKAKLKELGEAEDGKLSDADASQLHKHRILLHRRIEALTRGEDDHA